MNKRHFRLIGSEGFQPADLPKGLLYGTGVFTTFAAIPELPVFQPEAHYTRLVQGCAYFGIPLPWASYPEFETVITQYLQHHLQEPQVIRITVTPVSTPSKSDCILSTRVLPPHTASVTAGLVQFDRLFPGFKHLSHIAERVYLQQVQAKGLDDYIRLSQAGYLTESAYANLFLVTGDGVLLTPDAETAGCLPGIMRQAVLQVCRELNLKTQTGLYTPDLLSQVKGVFLTNAVRGLVPVSRIDDILFNPDEIQPLLARIKTRLKYPYTTLQPC